MNTVRGPKDYALLEELASGSDGNTYVARRAGAYSALVALKLVPEQLTTDQHLLARLSEEVQIARSLRHPNLIQVLELVLDDQSAAFVLDLNHGRTLGQLIDGAEAVGRRMTPAMVAVLVADIGRALHYLHEFELPGHALGLVHGNVSPRNVNVGFDGSVQLIETGLARAAGRKRSLLGGLGYMSPEQVAGEDADRRSDVYGLGIIMYELLCGRRVFAGLPSMTELRDALAHHPHAVPTSASWTGPALIDICGRALAPSADARYATCQDMVDDLERWIAEHVPTPTAVGLDLFAQEIAGVDEPDVMNVATMPPGSMLGRGRRMTTDGTLTDEPARSGDARERPTGASPASSSLNPEPSPIDTNVDHKAPSASPESPDTGLAESADSAPVSDVWSVMDFPDASGADAGWMADMGGDGGAFGDASDLAALSNDVPAAAPEAAAPEPSAPEPASAAPEATPADAAAAPETDTAPASAEAAPAASDDAPAEAAAALSASSDFDMFDSFGAPGEGVAGLAARPAPAEAPPAEAPEEEQEEEEGGKLQSALASDFSIQPLDMLVAADLSAPPPAEPEFASMPLPPAPGVGPLPELKSTGPDVLTMDLGVVPVARPSLLTPMAWAGIIGGGVFVVLIVVLVVILTGGDDKKTDPANGGAIAALQPDAGAAPEADAGAAPKEEKEDKDETWVKADDEEFPATDKDKGDDKAADKKDADSRRRRVARGAARRRGGTAGGGGGEAPAPPKDNGNWQARGQSLLTISCSAPAEITVDGKVVGRTPRSVPVSPGSHKVSMKRISDGRKYARTVNTSKGQQSPVACVFR